MVGAFKLLTISPSYLNRKMRLGIVEIPIVADVEKNVRLV